MNFHDFIIMKYNGICMAIHLFARKTGKSINIISHVPILLLFMNEDLNIKRLHVHESCKLSERTHPSEHIKIV